MLLLAGHSDVKISDVYDEITFENTDGGVWKQGWPIVLNQTRLKQSKLNIFVVPHSHNDPGWLKTFEQYFQGQTRHILNLATDFLNDHEDMKFIWAETSYFAFWWSTIKEEKRDVVKKLIKRGQLEIVTGGWVMNDEANAHYSSIINQMVEGHEWLRVNLGADVINGKIKNGWAIDPFGLSSTMAFILKRMNLDAMVIQRVHYSLKKYLASHQMLEFNWRQHFEPFNYHGLNVVDSAGGDNDHGQDVSTTKSYVSTASEKDILTHAMPFYSYDVPHTCGPDPKVCCQFDFRRMPPFKVNCKSIIHSY